MISIIISFIIVEWTLCNCVFQPSPLKSITLTPQYDSGAGVTLTIPSPTEVTTTSSAWEIDASLTSSDQFHLVVELDTSWGLYLDKPSIMTVDFEGHSTNSADLVIGFQSDHKCTSMKLIMNNSAPNTIYQVCDTAPNWDRDYLGKYLDTEILQVRAQAGYPRSCGLLTGDTNCPNQKDQKAVEMANIDGTTQNNSFPLQFIINNNPTENYSFLKFITSHQMCGYKSLPLETGFKIFFAVDHPGESCTINAIHITYFYNLTYNPTMDPTYDPTNNPTQSPTLNPSVTPTEHPTRAPTENPTTAIPSETPSKNPTLLPTTALPTYNPTTALPTYNPTTTLPTYSPITAAPTGDPTTYPTMDPSTVPTENPSDGPSLPPTKTPTNQQDGNVNEEETTDSGPYAQDDLDESTKAKTNFILLLIAIIIGGIVCLVLFGFGNMYLSYKENKKAVMKLRQHATNTSKTQGTDSHRSQTTHLNESIANPVINFRKHVDTELIQSMSAASPSVPKPSILDVAIFGETLDNLKTVNTVLMDDIIDDVEQVVDRGTAGADNNVTAGYVNMDDDAASDNMGEDRTEGDDTDTSVDLAMGYDDDDDNAVGGGGVTMGAVQTPFDDQNEDDEDPPPPPPPPPPVAQDQNALNCADFVNAAMMDQVVMDEDTDVTSGSARNNDK